MADPTLVNVLNARNDLLVNPDCCLLVQALVLNDVIKEFPVAAVLHDEVQFSLSFNDLVQS